METTKKTKRKSEGSSTDQLKKLYMEYLLKEGKTPVSVFKFCMDNGLKEEDFYQVAGSFEGLDKLIWRELIDSVITSLKSDDSFKEFSTREKVLTFYFSLFEKLKSSRSYVVYHLAQRKFELMPAYLKEFKKLFEEFFTSVLMQGKGSGEVANRPYLDKRYPQLFWFHFGFLLHFWKDDESAGFEQTDAAIEKSVNLAFDLIGKGAFDTAIDFAKFLYQNKMK